MLATGPQWCACAAPRCASSRRALRRAQEDSFHLVDSRPTRQNRGGRRFQPNRFQQRREAERRQETQIERGIPRKQQQKRQQFAQFHRYDQRVCLTPPGLADVCCLMSVPVDNPQPAGVAAVVHSASDEYAPALPLGPAEAAPACRSKSRTAPRWTCDQTGPWWSRSCSPPWPSSTCRRPPPRTWPSAGSCSTMTRCAPLVWAPGCCLAARIRGAAMPCRPSGPGQRRPRPLLPRRHRSPLTAPPPWQVFDRITPKAMRPLQRTQRVFRSVTTSDDPVIRRAPLLCAAAAKQPLHMRESLPRARSPPLSAQAARHHAARAEACAACRQLAGEDKARVFATDTVLTTLMCAARSVYSWDVVVTRVGDKLFFDSRWPPPSSHDLHHTQPGPPGVPWQPLACTGSARGPAAQRHRAHHAGCAAQGRQQPGPADGGRDGAGPHPRGGQQHQRRSAAQPGGHPAQPPLLAAGPPPLPQTAALSSCAPLAAARQPAALHRLLGAWHPAGRGGPDLACCAGAAERQQALLVSAAAPLCRGGRRQATGQHRLQARPGLWRGADCRPAPGSAQLAALGTSSPAAPSQGSW